MSKQDGKESIESQRKKIKKDLEQYDRETNIHNFKLANDYRNKFKNACELRFDPCKILRLKKKSTSNEAGEESQKEKINNF